MSSKKINKSLDLAVQLFPEVYASREKYKRFHFAFLFKRNTIVSIGTNNSDTESIKARWFAERYNLPQQRIFQYIHAEIDALSKLFGRQYIDRSYSMVVLRLNKFLELKMSKPCHDCKLVLLALGIDRVWWSDNNGNIQYGV